MRKTILTTVLIFVISIIPSPPLHPEDDATTLYRQGMEQYENKNYKSAYDFFRRALLKNPFNEEASNMYWKMKGEQKPRDLMEWEQDYLKDNNKAPDSNGKKEADAERPRKKEPLHRDARKDRESTEAIRELRGRVAELKERIGNREREIALLEEKNKQKSEADSNYSRKMFRISAAVLIMLLAVCTGMLIYSFVTISRRDKRHAGKLLPETVEAKQDAIMQEQMLSGHQVPYPYQKRQEAWNASLGGIIARQKDDRLAILTAEHFSKMEITIAGFVRLIEHRLNRDNNDFKVRKLCHDIGKKMGLTSVEMMELRTAALMKDIGFLLIPEALLLKEKALTKQEKQKVEKHVAHSLKIAQYTPQPPRILEAVEKHHERMDGSGYPYGIKGDSIPLFSRIIGVCDTFIALTSDRPYRAALDNDTALSVLERESNLFDPGILTMLFEIFGQDVIRSQKPGEYLFDKDLYPEETLSSRD